MFIEVYNYVILFRSVGRWVTGEELPPPPTEEEEEEAARQRAQKPFVERMKVHLKHWMLPNIYSMKHSSRKGFQAANVKIDRQFDPYRKTESGDELGRESLHHSDFVVNPMARGQSSVSVKLETTPEKNDVAIQRASLTRAARGDSMTKLFSDDRVRSDTYQPSMDEAGFSSSNSDSEFSSCNPMLSGAGAGAQLETSKSDGERSRTLTVQPTYDEAFPENSSGSSKGFQFSGNNPLLGLGSHSNDLAKKVSGALNMDQSAKQLQVQRTRTLTVTASDKVEQV
jgi:hypothetical protein